MERWRRVRGKGPRMADPMNEAAWRSERPCRRSAWIRWRDELVASDPGSNRLLATLAEDLGVVAAVVTLVLVTVLRE